MARARLRTERREHRRGFVDARNRHHGAARRRRRAARARRCAGSRRQGDRHPISARSRSRAARSRPMPSSRSRRCCSTRGATANAKPELEIFADDVKCAHGATVGELDRDAALLRGEPRPRSRRGRARCCSRGLSWGCGTRPSDRDAICRSGARCAAEGRMNAPARIAATPRRPRPIPWRSDDWHYLDSAATAQKPQAVIDAIAQAMRRDYATVHRGVYQRSSDMTLAATRPLARAASRSDRAATPNELVFTRGRNRSDQPGRAIRCRRTAATGYCCRSSSTTATSCRGSWPAIDVDACR